MSITEDLLKGIAIIIDDDFKSTSKKAKINKIADNISGLNLPIIKFSGLPNHEVRSNFRDIAFLILDWNLNEKNSGEIEEFKEIRIGTTYKKQYENENIDFINDIIKLCFAPIFVFTNEPVNKIEEILVKNNLYFRDKNNFIFIKEKSKVTNPNSLKKTILDWYKKNPHLYVLKNWEIMYHVAKNQTFHDLYSLSSHWPSVLWEAFEEDSVNPSSEILSIISQNVKGRFLYPSLEAQAIKKKSMKIKDSEIRKVLSGERFIINKQIDPKSIEPGDLFKINDKYYLNLRASCDTIARDNGNLDDIDIYVIKGKKIGPAQLNKKFNKSYGNFNENINEIIIFSIDESTTILFNSENFSILKWKELKTKRIGRLLHPYMTRVLQKHFYYQQRLGLNRIPKKALPPKTKNLSPS